MSENPQTSATRPKRILVVDDDPAVREMLVRVLASPGYVALPASSGRQALQLCEALPFDLVLLDLGMPGQDGWETLASLRRQCPGRPVIIVTAQSQQQVAAAAAGAVACFEKPLDFSELLNAVARVLGAVDPTSAGSAAAGRSARHLNPPL